MKRTNSNLSSKKSDLKFVVLKNNHSKKSSTKSPTSPTSPTSPITPTNSLNSSNSSNSTEFKRDINFYVKQSNKLWAEIL